MRKLIIISMILVSMSLISCQKESKNDAISREVITLTMYSEDQKSEDMGFATPVAKAITTATGVGLNIQYPIESVSDKIDLMITSGDYPDLIMVKDTHKLVDAGAYMDLRPLIDEYGPNLKKLYGKYFSRLKFSEEDPSIYVLPTKPVEEEVWEPIMGFQLQHAVVEALGYPELKTLEDYKWAIKTYKALYPEIDGQKTIGITMVIDDWRWLISLGNFSGFATGLPDDGNWFVDPETYEASYRFLREEEKEYFRWLNHMYHDGLIDPDSFVQDFDAYTAKIASGNVLGLIDAKWQYTYGETLLDSAGKEDKMYGQYPLQLDETTKAADFRDIGYIGGYGIGLSKDCQDPIAAIKFLDFMASDEGHVLRLWGIENEHYYYDDNGVRKIYEDQLLLRKKDAEYFKNTGITVYDYPFPMWGSGKKDATGNYYNPESKEVVIDNYSDIEKSILKEYGVETWAGLYPSADELPISVWGQAWDIPIPSESQVRYQLETCDAIMREGLIKALLVKPENFDLAWQVIMDDLESAGVHEMGIKFTKLIMDRIELWN